MKYGLFENDEETEDFSLSILYESDDEFLDAVENRNEREKMSGIKPPKPLVVNSDIDMSQEWNEWLELYENYSTANKMGTEEATIQVANFKACVGREALKVLNNLNLSDEEKKVLKTLKDKLTEHFAPAKNKTYERCQFHRIKQQANENFEDFLQKVQTQVKKCGYGANADEFVMDQIVVGVYSDTTRQKLWTEDELTLEKTKKICRAAERASKEMNELQSSGMDQNVNAFKTSKAFDCRRCGTNHGPRNCPAFGKKCAKCHKFGHAAKVCRAKAYANDCEEGDPKNKFNKKTKKGDKKVNALNDDSSDSDAEQYQIGAVYDGAKVDFIGENDKWSEKLKIGSDSLTVKLDTGAECSVLPLREASRLGLNIEKSNTKRIITYNNESIAVVGESKAKCESKGKSSEVTFKIVAENLTPILGRTMCEKLGFIVRVNEIDSKGCEPLLQ